MTAAKLTLTSFSIRKGYGAEPYTASIEFSDGYHNAQKLNLTAEQAAKVLDAACEALVEAAQRQAQLMAEQAGEHFRALAGRQPLRAICTEVSDAEVL